MKEGWKEFEGLVLEEKPLLTRRWLARYCGVAQEVWRWLYSSSRISEWEKTPGQKVSGQQFGRLSVG